MNKLLLISFALVLNLFLSHAMAQEATVVRPVSPGKMRPLSGGVSQETTGLTDNIQAVTSQVEKTPDDPEAHFLLGVAYSRTPYVERALQELQTAKKLARRQPEGYALFDRKIRDYEHLLTKNPDNTLLLYRLAFGYYLRGYATTHNLMDAKTQPASFYYDLSEQTFRHLIALDATDFSARNYLGYLLAEREPDKNYFAATSLWQESLAISNRNPGAYLLLGEAAMRKGNLRQAVDYSAKAVKARNEWLEASEKTGIGVAAP